MTPPTLAELLDLERLDRDLFRGQNEPGARERYSLYGGQVAAQALAAAGATVSDDRLPPSFQGYFLRPGRIDLPVIFDVNRDRDGGSARHVRTVQHGEVIFSMLASFHAHRESPTFDAVPTRDAPDPETLVSRPSVASLVEVREVTPTRIIKREIRHPDGLASTTGLCATTPVSSAQWSPRRCCCANPSWMTRPLDASPTSSVSPPRSSRCPSRSESTDV